MIVRATTEADYWHARALQEQAAAQRATSEAARERHDELAAMYRFRESFFKKAVEPVE
jgi:hypothetical protein